MSFQITSSCECLLSHLEQAYGFFPVWTLSWIFKGPHCVNDFSHLEQLNGFSPVWILSCTFLYSWHFEEANGFSSLWILKFQSTTLCKWLFTFSRNKWPLSCMGPFMCFQMCTLLVSLATLGTCKWLISCANSFMYLQITTEFKWSFHIVNRQIIYLLYGSSHLMLFQIPFWLEWLVTLWRSKYPLTCVGPLLAF